jgi:hypothetical protein
LFRRRPPSAAHPGQHRARRIWLGGKETKLGRDREIALDRDTTALLVAYRDHCRQQAAAHDTELASNGFIFSSVPDGSVCLAPASLGQRFHRLIASLGIQTTRPARRLESWIGALATSTNGSGRRRPTERKACPIVTDLAAFAELVPLDHGLCVVSTLRGDGGVQSSVVNAGVLEHPLGTGQVVGLVATCGSRKLHNLRADPRATIVARAGWRWATVEGDAEIIGPDDPHPDLDSEALRLLLRDISGACGRCSPPARRGTRQ